MSTIGVGRDPSIAPWPPASAPIQSPPAHPPRLGLITSGITEITTMPIIDIITSLRPKGATAQDLQAALTRAVEAQAEQSSQVQHLLHERDALLLDGSSTAMAAADAALIAGRDTAEKIASVVSQLQARLAAAEEAETVARVKALLAQFQSSDQALSAWWVKMRKKLATELTAGVELLNTTNDARNEHDRAAAAAAERYPHKTFAQPTLSPVYAYAWPRDLQSSATMADVYADSFTTLLTAGDPKPAGTF